MNYLDHAWLSSHFTVVARHLPNLLRDAQLAALTASDADQVAAARSLVVAYRLASSMLLKFETNDVAWLAADRAIHMALAVDDTFALARATRRVARAMSTREHELLSPYGMLFLAASITAASQEDAALALTMHEEALTRTGQYQEAVRRLSEAERIAPEEVRCRPLAHGLVRSLLNNTIGERAHRVRQMAARAGVTA